MNPAPEGNKRMKYLGVTFVVVALLAVIAGLYVQQRFAGRKDLLPPAVDAPANTVPPAFPAAAETPPPLQAVPTQITPLPKRIGNSPALDLPGVVHLPFSLPTDSRVTLALYNRGGMLIRILVQAIDLKAGKHSVPWDGLDIWGHVVPAGAELVLKVFCGPGVRAFFEFAVARGDTPLDHPAWHTGRFTKDGAPRMGGWLGDHTEPSAVLAKDDKVFMSSICTEHGHNLIATDLDGNKLWGRQVESWRGPHQLFDAGDAIIAFKQYAHSSGWPRRELYRVDPKSFRVRKIWAAPTGSPYSVRCTANAKRILYLHKEVARADIFRSSVGRSTIDPHHALPPRKNRSRQPHPGQLLPEDCFKRVFSGDPGFDMALVRAVDQGDHYGLLVPFTKPRPIGTVVLLNNAEVWIHTGKKPPAKHAWVGPKGKLGTAWKKLGRPRNRIITAPPGTIAHAVYLRTPKTPKSRPTAYRFVRFLPLRFAPVVVKPTVALPAGAKALKETGPGGWRCTTAEPVLETAPATVTITYPKAIAMDGVLMMNNTSRHFTVEAEQRDGTWHEVASRHAGNKRRGVTVASTLDAGYFFSFPERITTRRLRLRITKAFLRGRIGFRGSGRTNPHHLRCDWLLPLALVDARDRPDPQVVYEIDPVSGKARDQRTGNWPEIERLALHADNTLYSVLNRNGTRQLARGQFDTKQGFRWQPLKAAPTLARVTAMSVVADEILVADEKQKVYCLDRNGKVLRALGRGPHRSGPYDRNRLGGGRSGAWSSSPGCVTGLTRDRNGKYWTAEYSQAPKRVARFSADGRTCEKQFLGPPQYGGGGHLSKDLKYFYYRSQRFDVDFETGESKLAYLFLNPSFANLGRPVEHNGFRYLVRDPAVYQGGALAIVVEQDNGEWRPAVLMGKVDGSFVLQPDMPWYRRVVEAGFVGKRFIWCDRNDDGKYQDEELEVFDKETGAVPGADITHWTNWLSSDLTVWNPWKRSCISPTRFTAKGTPIYESAKARKVGFPKLPSAHHLGTYPSLCVKGPGGGPSTVFSRDNEIISVLQPYRLRLDGSVVGGTPPTDKTDFCPRVHGKIISTPIQTLGSVYVNDEVGEVVLVNSDRGAWCLMSARDRVLLDTIFTGADGHWSGDLPAKRGTEVTGRQHGFETFGGSIVKADNGRVYVVSGKGFHGISRLEGLDRIRVDRRQFKVTPEIVARATTLRPTLAAAHKRIAATKKRDQWKNRLSMAAVAAAKLKLDGNVGEWPKDAFQPIPRAAAEKAPFRFAAACDKSNLILAYKGRSATGNNSEDWRYIFRHGFGFDLQWRQRDAGDWRVMRDTNVIKGDCRLVIARYEGKWRGVLYDYAAPAGKNQLVVESPVGTTRINRVVLLPENALTVKLNGPAKGVADWTAEIRIPWTTLGFTKQPRALLFDAGFLVPDTDGSRVVDRALWANANPDPPTDAPSEARILPGAWGKMVLGK